MNPDNPGHTTVELRNIKWAGRSGGASRIHLGFRRYRRPRDVTPEFQQQLRDLISADLEAGRNVPANWLGEELPEDTIGFWDQAVMVRTADGTWRMGRGKWCFKMKGTGFRGIPGKPLKCPEDPNPAWSDDLASIFLWPPNVVYYWRSATPEQQQWFGRPPT